MEQSIINFNKQFEYDPIIRNEEKLKADYKHFVLCGMGGSHLAAGIIKVLKPGIELYVHRDYDLPPYDDEFLQESLLIASSHSGNTEEVLDFLKIAMEKNLDVLILTTGGKLFDIAVDNQLPHVLIPDDDIEPRLAIGFSTIALAKILREDQLLNQLKETGSKIDPAGFMEEGKNLAKEIGSKIPVIYTSNSNLTIAYNWKIKFNETAKTPAFYNLFPELNHNEMQGFAGSPESSDKFHFIVLHDAVDSPRIERRMQVTSQILEEKGYVVTNLYLSGENNIEKLFSSLLIADWTALEIAKIKGTDPQSVPDIENFKVKLG